MLHRKVVESSLQHARFKCCVDCTGNSSTTAQQVQQCIQRCDGPIESVNQTIQSELQRFQERVNRCAMSCSDELRDKYSISQETDPKLLQRAEGELNACLAKCGSDHMDTIPALEKRISEAASKLR